MKKIALLMGGILLLSISAAAQDLPKFDVFGGYSYIHYRENDPGGTLTANLNGADGSVAFYPNKWFGGVADFGVSKLSSIKQGSFSGNVDATLVNYLFGPRIRFGTKAVTPFGQVLFGGVHLGQQTSSDIRVCGVPGSCTVGDSENAFAMTVEGGVDVKLAKHLAVRGQGGYLMTRFKVNGSAKTENNARILVGIVIH